MREHASCGACGADDAFLLFLSPDRRNPSSDERFPVGRCHRCGHAYVLQRPTPAQIGGYYPADYVGHRSESSDEGGRGRRRPWLRGVSGARILDVGCGSGFELLRLREHGSALFGVETNATAAGLARSKGITIFEGPTERADFPDGHFHLVLLHHCLEHFHDPGAALANVARMTHPEGRIHVTLPTIDGIVFRLFRRHWYHLDVPRHLQFFTHDSFRRLVSACGMSILRRSCPPNSGFRRSLAAAGEERAALRALSRLLRLPPLPYLIRVTLRFIVNGLRQGDVAEYLLRPAPFQPRGTGLPGPVLPAKISS